MKRFFLGGLVFLCNTVLADIYPGDTVYTEIIQELYYSAVNNDINMTRDPSITSRNALCQLLVDRHNNGYNSNAGQAQTNADFIDHDLSVSDCIVALQFPTGFGSPDKLEFWAGRHQGKWYDVSQHFDDEADWKHPVKEDTNDPVNDVDSLGNPRVYDFQEVEFLGRTGQARYAWNQSHPEINYVWGWDPKNDVDRGGQEGAHIGFPFTSGLADCIVWLTPAEAFLECMAPGGVDRLRVSTGLSGYGQWSVANSDTAWPNGVDAPYVVNDLPDISLSVCNNEPIIVNTSRMGDPMFVSLQLSDQWWNRYGNEEYEWFYQDRYPHYIKQNWFDLREFAAARGLLLQPGQYYRLYMNSAETGASGRLIHINPNCSTTQSAACGTIGLPSCDCKGSVEVRLDSNSQDGMVSGLASNHSRVFADAPNLRAAAWTNNSIPNTWRAFMKFPMPTLPNWSSVDSANLYLYAADEGAYYAGPHSQYTHENSSYLRRVTSQWSESNLTWLNQPNTTTSSQLFVPASNSPHQTYNLNVSNWVKGYYAGSYPNYGFALRLRAEQRYSSLNFASGDNDDASKRPRLRISYSCNLGPTFTVTGSTSGNRSDSMRLNLQCIANNQTCEVQGNRGISAAPCYLNCPTGSNVLAYCHPGTREIDDFSISQGFTTGRRSCRSNNGCTINTDVASNISLECSVTD